MYCKKCGSALPSYGFICKSCGTMMDSEQIKMQKEYMKNDNNEKSVNLLSDLYQKNSLKKDYTPRKDSKLLGALLIILVMIVLIIIAILKVM